MCKQRIPPHARPPPGSGGWGSGRPRRVGSVVAEPGRDRRFPALRPQARGHRGRRGGSGLKEPRRRRSGAGERRRCAPEGWQGAWERQVRGGRPSAAAQPCPGALPATVVREPPIATPRHPPSSCLNRDIPEGSYRVSVFLPFFFLSFFFAFFVFFPLLSGVLEYI